VAVGGVMEPNYCSNHIGSGQKLNERTKLTANNNAMTILLKKERIKK